MIIILGTKKANRELYEVLYGKRGLAFNPLSVTTGMKVIAWVFELGKISQLEFLHAWEQVL